MQIYIYLVIYNYLNKTFFQKKIGEPLDPPIYKDFRRLLPDSIYRYYYPDEQYKE